MKPRYVFTVKYKNQLVDVAANHPDEISGILDPINPPSFTVESVLDTEAVKPDKYFLCFGFNNFCDADLKPFHVTLIYFGELTEEEIEDVEFLVGEFVSDDNFFMVGSHSFTFHKEAMFGTNNDIRVLLPTQDNHMTEILKNDVNELLSLVGKYRKHRDFPFNPHLTTDLKYFSGTFQTLYLCKNNYEVVEAWDLLQ